jgi:hypothetical protein
MSDLRISFRNFLERAQDESWIASYEWYKEDNFKKLKQNMKKVSYDIGSTSHKKSTDGNFWGIIVECFEGTSIGVDLELLIDRPVLKNTEWLSQRFGISKSSTPKQIMEEWACREAAFKCFAPDNQNLYLSQIRKSAPNTYSIFSTGGGRSVQTRIMWRDNWVLALAWRSH